MGVKSELITIDKLLAMNPSPRFSIPIYQRLYVWGDDQVKTLLEDLNTAYRQGKDLYYLGGILVVERSDRYGNRLEIIDGQQRFTTLWMLSAAWGKALKPFLTVNLDGQVCSRLQFAIRPDVNRFMMRQIERATGSESPEEVMATSQMRGAIALMESFLSDREQDIQNLAGLTEFIFTKVMMVLSTVPPNTDLNKLFEIINNRGVQLQHHEILKARMLDALGDQERARYALLWDACADMGNYVELNLRDLAELKIGDLFNPDEAATGSEILASASNVLKHLRVAEESGRRIRQSLAHILAGVPQTEQPCMPGPPEQREAEDRVRSIFSFPVFLQHVLRIWLHARTLKDLPRILDRELLDLFDEHFFGIEHGGSGSPSEDAQSFIELLWELRYLFDKYVIKWVDRGEEEQHLVASLRRLDSGGYVSLTRDREESGALRGLSLLESMLYHSQQITTQYWLTPFLAFVWKTKSGISEYYRYLRHLDNHLLCCVDGRPLVERTRDFLTEPWKKNRLVCEQALEQPLGVGFPHYWFYKLEFILWLQGPDRHGVTEQEMRELWSAFRFTAKNSVEHVSPQTRQEIDRHEVTAEMLNRFGNLALVSRGVNSEYGNLPFNEKRERFVNRNQQKLDSLKLALIYQQKTWCDALAKEHESKMIKAFGDYFAES